ncbi:glycosyl transferase [Fundidesulfovibrio soli]|uniref:glycosyl transferase n=1 Tax=Fundidesulfovibrio soli TaxID=2922716 RepID=UPI001FAE7D64|nr:glycosyl transferase [Fundidesulfovibrio soli]
MRPSTIFSVITPSRGDRPLALEQAGRSLEAATRHAEALGLLAPGQVEWLVGFDGLKGLRPHVDLPARFVDFPKYGDFGHRIRDNLLPLAKGSHLLFLDDDNAFTESALASYMPHLEHELIVARIDVSRAFPDVGLLPRPGPDSQVLRQCNVDTLCVCVARDLALTRGRGWTSEGGYQADFVNIRRYWRRARSVKVIEDVVGVYDAGRGLDAAGVSERQALLEPGD